MGAFGPLYHTTPTIYAPVSVLTPILEYNTPVLPFKSLALQQVSVQTPDDLLEPKIFRQKLWITFLHYLVAFGKS